MPAVNGLEQIQINEDHEDITEENKTENENLENGTANNTRQTMEKFRRNCAGSILNRLVNEERKKVLQTLTHSIMPGFNISVTKTSLKKLSAFPLFQCTVPHPVYVSFENGNKVDLCHKRTISYYDYMYSLNRQRAFYEIAARKKDFRKSIKKGVYPYTVVSYAELLENNPDPYFQARYDWYYTGGNLKCNSENNLICHSIGSNLNELALSKLKKKSKSNSLKRLTAIEIEQLDNLHNSEIFEIQSLALKNRFSVRQKYSLSFLTYDDIDLNCDYILSAHNEIPIISSASDNLDSEIIVTGNLNKEVFLWDVNKSTKIPKQKLFENILKSTEKTKNWNCLRTFDKNIYAFTTLNEFCLLDSRQSANESNTNLCTFGKYKEICEDISSIAKSSYNNLIYIGTTHKLFTVDTRFMGKQSTNKYIVQRWTHQMESSPLMLKTYKWSENYELILMSSLLPGDIRICENFCKFKNDKYKYTSPCLPFMPPSLLDGYKVAKTNGECLDPFTNLHKRINSCTTGLDFLKRNDNLYMMMSNSLGDVFSTKLNFNDDIIYTDHNNKEIIMKYDEQVKIKLEKNPLSLNLTDFVELQGMSKVFRCKQLNNLNNSVKMLETSNNDIDKESLIIEDINDEPKRPKRKAKWQKSVTELYAYKDVLASNLLAVWDMELNEEKDILPVIDKKLKKKHDVVKVNEWLNESNFLNDTLPVDESTVENNTITFNTVIHSTLKPTNEIEFNPTKKTRIIEDSFVTNIDNIMKMSTQYNENSMEKMDIDDSFDVTKESVKTHSDNEIPPAQKPAVTAKPKTTEKRKRTYVKGF